jgi:hypothetical protein
MNTCGECRWHYAMDAAIERTGWKNCMALPYPQCIEFFSKPEAVCSFHELFTLPVITGSLRISL